MRRIYERSSSGAEPRSRAGHQAASGDSRFRPPPRVLHVERDTFVAALVHATLQDAGFDVDWYPNLDTALARAPAAQYDVCLLQGDLVGTRRRTRAETVATLARGAPIVFLTDKLDRERSPHVSMLSRPFSPRALVEAVETAVQKRCRAA